MMRLMTVFSLLLSALLTDLATAAESAPPNVVVMYVDDLGWRDIG